MLTQSQKEAIKQDAEMYLQKNGLPFSSDKALLQGYIAAAEKYLNDASSTPVKSEGGIDEANAANILGTL
jgi:ketopantoate hydroxymethyltransferase